MDCELFFWLGLLAETDHLQSMNRGTLEAVLDLIYIETNNELGLFSRDL